MDQKSQNNPRIFPPPLSVDSLWRSLQNAGLLQEPNRSPPAPAGDVHLIWDSRQFPESAPTTDFPSLAFVARRGHTFDGHSLAETVLEKGFIFIGEPRGLSRDVCSHPNTILITSAPDALICLLDAATIDSAKPKHSIAVTGTSGKTTTVQIIGSCLNQLQKKPILRIGTLGIRIGTSVRAGTYPTMPDYPGFLEALCDAGQANCDYAVFEATSHGMVECRMGTHRANVSVFLNLSQDHLDFHSTMDQYCQAKAELFSRFTNSAGSGIINVADPCWQTIIANAPRSISLIGFGTTQMVDQFFAHELVKEFASARFLGVDQPVAFADGIGATWKLFYNTTDPARETVTVRAPLLGNFQQENLAASAATLVALGFPLHQVAKAMTQIEPVPGRLEIVPRPSPVHPTVLVDYAHKPDALEKALAALRPFVSPGGKLVCVFGCGGDRDTSKRAPMAEIAERLADTVIVTSDNPRTEDPEKILDDIFAGFSQPQKASRIPDRREAIRQAISTSAANDVVVIAGKGHEDYQIIGTSKSHFSDREEAEATYRRSLGQGDY